MFSGAESRTYKREELIYLMNLLKEQTRNMERQITEMRLLLKRNMNDTPVNNINYEEAKKHKTMELVKRYLGHRHEK